MLRNQFREALIKTRILSIILILFMAGSLLFSACKPAASVPVSNADNTAVDDWLGPYAPERLWGNPREAINSDGWTALVANLIYERYHK